MGLIYCYTIYGVYLDKGEGGEIIHRMLTFHSIWTKPATLRGVEEMSLWDFEWLTWLAGILEARNYGPVVLVADERGKTFVEKVGLAKFYDEIVLGLDHIPSFIDPEIFWAAGKFFAMQHCQENFIMIDLDAEIRFKLDLSDCDVFCAHKEEVSEGDLWFYPNPEYLHGSYFC